MPGMRRHDSPPVRRGFDLRDVKALDDGAQGRFSGYLAVFDNVDYQGDRILPGAFAKSLNDLKARQQSRSNTPGGRYLFPIYWNHNSDDPIGGFVDALEDSHGLYVVGELDLDTEKGQQAYSGISKGYVPAMSIGYFVVTYAYDRNNTRLLRELALFEGSLVSNPANPEAVIMEVKSADDAAKKAQQARSKRYKIGIKDSGNVTKPSEFASVPDSQWADPVNYRYPMKDKQHADNAASRWGDTSNHDGYTSAEVDIISKRIEKRQESFGESSDDDSKGISMQRKAKAGGVEVAADGTHAAFTGTHTHAHKAFGSQGEDDTHEHEHSHDGDANHEHAHGDSGKSAKPTKRKARTFEQVFTTDREAYDILEDLDDLWCALRESLLSVLIEGANSDGDNATATESLDQFSNAVMSWLEAAEMQDCWGDIADAADDAQADMADYALYDIDASVKPYYGYMALSTDRAGAKAGRAISEANATAMQKALDMMQGGHTAAAKGMQQARAGHKAATALLKAMAEKPGASSDDESDTTYDADAQEGAESPMPTRQGGKAARTHTHAPGATLSDTTQPRETAQPVTADEISRIIQRKMQAARMAAALGTQQSA